MFRSSLSALALAIGFSLALCSQQAEAQNAGNGIVDSLKNALLDPNLRSYVSNKVREKTMNMGSAPAGLPLNLPFGANTAASAIANVLSKRLPASPVDLSVFKRPESGFYSLEEGARLGGIGYDRSPEFNPALSTEATALPFSAPMSATRGLSFSTKLNPAELQSLRRFDLSVLVDSSGSMNTKDSPDFFDPAKSISRWQWCAQQSSFLAGETASLPQGISLIPFSSSSDRYSNVSPASVAAIFKSRSPQGGTNLSQAISAELDNYFNKRDAGMRVRPLMLAVITDGVTDDEASVLNVIQNTAYKLKNASEIKIDFFLIGNERKGEKLIERISSTLPALGLPANMITKHSFAELQNIGLARALASSAANTGGLPARAWSSSF